MSFDQLPYEASFILAEGNEVDSIVCFKLYESVKGMNKKHNAAFNHNRSSTFYIDPDTKVIRIKLY